MKTYVYVDGFNLYYGKLRGSPYRWLDLNKLCALLLPGNTITKIKYFTARVSARPDDPGQPVRQQIYLRALSTLPNVEIHYGHFLSYPIWMTLVVPYPAEQLHANRNKVYVRVLKTEEKGSDVNIAAYLVRDAFRDEFEVAVIISNDSDLLAPIQIVRGELGKSVGVINPHRKASRVLVREAEFVKTIRHGVLRASQFPPSLTDAHGTFSKPAEW